MLVQPRHTEDPVSNTRIWQDTDGPARPTFSYRSQSLGGLVGRLS